MFLDPLKKKMAALFSPDVWKAKASAFRPGMLLKYSLDFLLYFACCLPFLRILPIPSDMQPLALIVAVVYLIVYGGKMRLPDFHRRTFWIFAFAAVIAVANPTFDRMMSTMLLARKTYNYAAVFLISLAMAGSLERTKGLKEGWIKLMILLWLFVGVMQTLVDREFLRFLISNYRTSTDRGVTSLASEPSFYGYVMVFFFVLASEFKQGKRFYQILCLAQILLLAQSAVAVVYLLVFLALYIGKEIVFFHRNAPKQKKIKLIIAGICIVTAAVAVPVVAKTMADSRLIKVFAKMFSGAFFRVNSIQELYEVDISVAERVKDIFAAFQGFVQARGLPNGFGQIIVNGMGQPNLMTGYGAVIYEMGLVGVMLVTAITCYLIRGLKNGFVYGLGITIIMFSAIQLGSPAFALVLAYGLYAGKKLKPTDLTIQERKESV